MTTLTISHEDLDTLDVADVLATAGISCDVIPGYSVVGGRVERRAEVRIYDAAGDDPTPEGTALTAWFVLNARLGCDLTCAWYASDGYQGCVKNHPAYSISAAAFREQEWRRLKTLEAQRPTAPDTYFYRGNFFLGHEDL